MLPLSYFIWYLEIKTALFAGSGREVGEGAERDGEQGAARKQYTDSGAASGCVAV